MIWQIHPLRSLDLRRTGLVMGIVNVTPDSFSDGGKFLAAEEAVARGLEQWRAGAGILDIGGESTRPGAPPVSMEEELRRVLPVIQGIKAAVPEAVVSIDTMKAEVARQAIAAGADIINDVTGLTGDPDMAGLAAASGCGVVVMHMQGTPRTMQAAPRYDDVVAEVSGFFLRRMAELGAGGLRREQLVFDPGIGFGKTLEHNLALLRALPDLAPAGRPLLLGVSRKSFIGGLLGTTDLAARDWPTVALTSFAREAGVRVVRVHDVAPNVQAMRMTEAILGV
jgi:dihydropteroate synthase